MYCDDSAVFIHLVSFFVVLLFSFICEYIKTFVVFSITVCKTCIVNHVQAGTPQSTKCPVCEVVIHKTRPLASMRLDKTLQDIVFKLVPGLYEKEVERRRAFHEKRKCYAIVQIPPFRYFLLIEDSEVTFYACQLHNNTSSSMFGC